MKVTRRQLHLLHYIHDELEAGRQPTTATYRDATGFTAVMAGNLVSKLKAAGLLGDGKLIQGTRAKLLQLNKKSAEVIKLFPDSPSLAEVTKEAELIADRSRGANKPKPLSAPPLIPAPAPAPNISRTADSLADSVSALIAENAAYREVIEKIGRHCAQLLDMELVPNGSSTQD